MGGNRAKLNAQQLSELQELLRRSTPRTVLGAVAAAESGQFWTVSDLRRVLAQR
jgi:transposase